MTTTDPMAPGGNGLIDRAKNIILTPRAEWDRIVPEPADIGKLYTGYVLPLAVLSAACAFIGMSVFGVSFLGVTARVPMVTGLVTAVIQVVSALVGVYVLALITNALAPNFGSQPDAGQAHKLSAYGSTAGFLAGVFTIFPPLAMLGILGLYSLFLLYVGLPRMMKTPEDKRVGYFATIIVVAIVLGIVMSVVLGFARTSLGGFAGAPGMTFGQHSATPAPSSVQGQVTLPGGGTLDLSELEKMGQAYAGGAQGAGAMVDPAQLQAFLPPSLPGGFSQVSVSNSSGGAAGMGISQAEGVYQRGDARMTLTVVHMGAIGGLASMAGAMNVQESRQDADGYSRTNSVNGRMVNEEMSRSSNTAKYGIVGRGVAITADGSNGATVEEARAAVEAVGIERLEAVSATAQSK